MVRPRQNLDPQSQQWARSVEADLDQLIQTQRVKDQTLENTLSGLANSLTNLGGLVQTLSAQQEQLQTQQTQILNLLDNLIGYTSLDQGTYSGTLNAGTSWTTIGSGNLSLPAGTSNALVYMTANGSLAGSGGVSGSMYVLGAVRCVIAGSAGRSQLLETYTTAGAANATSSQTRIIASPGTSIPIEMQVQVYGSTQTTGGYYTGNFSAFVIYNR